VFGKDVKNQNCIHEKIKSRPNLLDACCYAVQNLLSSRLLSINLKIKIYKTFLVPLYGCGTVSLALNEVHRLGVFQNRVLRRIFGPKRS
jgi:hypothetical protein